ncbi:DNA-binding transcriptional regulator, LysR family [Variovorax sp. PDC80]|uniref:LysR family transcriptional regulator n=1 Tax=Variovorax sp. PDC80 TaxID=1882827 RepID=UPI0008E93111|nr:LysR family transcriptional regulator [Variovorax sp. PDC80]SFQ13442.1 DNA-binding transcriptional regulator, LysR family [Variovorax sp. PDC80]
MDTIECMRIFVEIARRRSFRATADVLGVSSASISRHVAFLEGRLGIRLLNRTTRTVSLSSNGQNYYESCLQALAAFDKAQTAVSGRAAEPSGPLRLSLPGSFTQPEFVAMLARFSARYPKINLDISATDAMVDLVERGVDVALRFTANPDESLAGRCIGQFALWLCVSPAYVARYRMPKSLADLAMHPCLGYAYHAGGDTWTLSDGSQTHEVRVRHHLKADNGELLRAGVRTGMGVALLPSFQIQAALADGSLLRVLPQWQSPPVGVWLVYSHRRHQARNARVFIEHFSEELQALFAAD